MDAEERERNKHMIDNPREWPLLVLPMKRRVPQGFAELGYLKLGTLDWESNERVLTHGTIFETSENKPTTAYIDTDALLDDGWEVD